MRWPASPAWSACTTSMSGRSPAAARRCRRTWWSGNRARAARRSSRCAARWRTASASSTSPCSSNTTSVGMAVSGRGSAWLKMPSMSDRDGGTVEAGGGLPRYARVERDEDVPAPDPRAVDVAVLDMNHGWPNLGHDSLVHSLLEGDPERRRAERRSGVFVRVLSYDVRRCGMVPEPPAGGRFAVYVGTGGPGYIDPARNDGVDPSSQGLRENPRWEAPLFRLLEAIRDDPGAALFAVCHSFGVICRWTGIARPVLRGAEKGGKSTGMLENVLTAEAAAHPWFGRFARPAAGQNGQSGDGGHRLRILDNRLFDLIEEPRPLPAGGARHRAATARGGGAPRRRDARRGRAARRGADHAGAGARRRRRDAADLCGQSPPRSDRPRPPARAARAEAAPRRGERAVGGRAARDPHSHLPRRGQREPPAADVGVYAARAAALLPLSRAAGARGGAAAALRPARGPGAAERGAGHRMSPRPPFDWELTPEQEIAAFEQLKPRLRDVWDTLTLRDQEPHTSVVVPSLTLDRDSLSKLAGASFYEERLLFLLIRLRNPRAGMVYVTSQPVHPLILEYYFQLLAGMPASHARSRLTLLCAYDASPRSLTEKVLERPRLIQRIRDGIQDPARAYLTVFNATPFERRLAVLLGIPLNGCDPQLAHLGTKSGSRKVFREAGVPLPEGMEDLRDRTDVEAALVELRRRRPGLRGRK